MNKNDWKSFKRKTELKFESLEIDYKNTWGFQIQKNTKWNKGLKIEEIKKLEEYFGFQFSLEYIEMLMVFNGFDIPHISINPEKLDEVEFQRRCYKYPEDLENTKWLIKEAHENIKYVKKALEINGFENYKIEGFIPLIEHRILVILKDKSLSPVVSVWNDDIILYGNSLYDYWCNELGI